MLLLLLLLLFAIVFSVPINILFHQTKTFAERFIIARRDFSDDLM